MDAERLADIAKAEGDVYTAQRLGYLLDQVGAGAVGAALAAWIASLRPRFVHLRSDRPARHAAKDARWRVLANETVEAAT